MSKILHIHSAGSGGVGASQGQWVDTDAYWLFQRPNDMPDDKNISHLRLDGVGAFDPQHNPLYINPNTGESTLSKHMLQKSWQVMTGFLRGWMFAEGELHNIQRTMYQLLEKQATGELPDEILLTGHSRGAVQTVLLAKLIYLMFGEKIKVAIIRTDPCGAPLELQDPDKSVLSPNVYSCTTIYAQDEKFLMAQNHLMADPKKTTITSFSLPGNHGFLAQKETQDIIQNMMKTYWESKREKQFSCTYVDVEITPKNIDRIREKMDMKASVNTLTSPLVVQDKKGDIYVLVEKEQQDNQLVKVENPALYASLFQNIPKDISGKLHSIVNVNEYEIVQDLQKKTGKVLQTPLKLPEKPIEKMTGKGIRAGQKFFQTTFPVDPVWEAKKINFSQNTPEEREQYWKAFYKYHASKQAPKEVENDPLYKKWRNVLGENAVSKINAEIEQCIRDIKFLQPGVQTEAEHCTLTSLIHILDTLKIPEGTIIEEAYYQNIYMQMQSVNQEINNTLYTLKCTNSPVLTLFAKIQEIWNGLLEKLRLPFSKMPAESLISLYAQKGIEPEKTPQSIGVQDTFDKKGPVQKRQETGENIKNVKSLPEIPKKAGQSKSLPPLPLHHQDPRGETKVGSLTSKNDAPRPGQM